MTTLPLSVQAIWHVANVHGRSKYLAMKALRRHPWQHDPAYGARPARRRRRAAGRAHRRDDRGAQRHAASPHGAGHGPSWASSTSRPTRSPTAALWLDPRRGDRARRASWSPRAPAILDVGGESTRPGRRAGAGRRGAAPRRARDRGLRGARRRAAQHRHRRSSRSRARALDAGATLRQRRHRLPRRPGAGRRSSPSAAATAA